MGGEEEEEEEAEGACSAPCRDQQGSEMKEGEGGEEERERGKESRMCVMFGVRGAHLRGGKEGGGWRKEYLAGGGEWR